MESELNQVHKTKRIYQTFLSNLIWYSFTSSALHEKISQKTTITGSDDLGNSNYQKFNSR